MLQTTTNNQNDMNNIKNFFKANGGDIKSLLIFVGGFTLLGRGLASLDGLGLWFLPNIAYLLAIASLCIHLPWLFIAITMPNSIGAFVANGWESAWNMVVDSAGNGANEEEVAKARWQLGLTIKIYLFFFVGLVALSCAIFLGTPVGG